MTDKATDKVTDKVIPLASCGSSSRALFAGRLAINFKGALLHVAGTDELLGVTGKLGDLVQTDPNGRIANACFDVQLEGTCGEHDARVFPLRYTLDVERVVESRPVTNAGPCLPSKVPAPR